MDGSTRRHDAFREIVHAKTFQRNRVQLLVENLVGVVVGKDPVVENGEVILAPEQVDEVLAFVALYQNLRRVKTLQQFVNVFVRALREEKLARRDI